MKLKAQKGKGKEKAEQAALELKPQKPLKKGKTVAKETPIVKKSKEKIVAAVKEGKQKKKAPAKVPEDDDDEEEAEEQEESEDEEKVESEDEEQDESINSKNGLVEEEAEEDDGEDDDEGEEEGAEDDEGEEEEAEDDEEEPSKSKVATKAKKAVKVAEEQDDESDDEAPEETPIAKKPTTTAAPLVDFKRIPKGTPNENIIFVKNLPAISDFDRMEVANIFSKYGVIKALLLYPTGNKSTALVAYTTPEAATAALETHEKVKVGNNTLNVSLKKSTANPSSFNNELTVYVGNLSNATTVDGLKEHFKDCGEISSAYVYGSKSCFGFLEFKNADDLEKALKLNCTELDGNSLEVRRKVRANNEKDEEHTITLENQQNFQTFEEQKLRKIFSKCGDIRSVEMLCKKQVLAFVTFVDSESVEKALKLDGNTEEGLEIQIKKYSMVNHQKLIIFIKNVAENVDESALRKLFEQCGEVGTIKQNAKFNTATVQFADKDAFCKSFLLNEHFFGNTPIFIQPFSIKKAIASKKRRAQEAKRAKKNIGKPVGPHMNKPKRAPFGGQQGGGGFTRKFVKVPANANGDANPAPFYRAGGPATKRPYQQNNFNENSGKRPFKPQNKQNAPKRPKQADNN